MGLFAILGFDMRDMEGSPGLNLFRKCTGVAFPLAPRSLDKPISNAYTASHNEGCIIGRGHSVAVERMVAFLGSHRACLDWYSLGLRLAMGNA